MIGMGRHGAGNLTASSDLDLIFVYDVPVGAISDGEKSLAGVAWFTRYVRRLVTALSAQTEEGGLYDVDMALRPSGGAGPAAVSLSAFEQYYAKDAWTWEDMALVKARMIAGEGDLSERLDEHINEILTRPREVAKIRADVLDMRRRLLAQKPANSFWDLKLVQGGLTDIDFICQYLSLIHGDRHGRFPLHIAQALPVFFEKGFLEKSTAAALIAAARDYESIMQISRASLGRTVTQLEDNRSLIRRIAASVGASDLGETKMLLLAHREQVKAAFIDIIGPYEQAIEG